MISEKLESIVARAVAVTMGTDTTTDSEALLNESSPLWGEISAHAAEELPAVTSLAARLKKLLDSAPPSVRAELDAYYTESARVRFDYINPPRSVVAFILLDAIERIRDHCKSKVEASPPS